MKNAIVIAAVGLLSALTCVSAQPLKVGFVDIQQLLQESAPSKAASARLENEFGPRSRELARLEASLREAADKLDKESLGLSEQERSRRGRDLATQQRELDRKRREFQEDAERRQQEEQRVVRERVDRALKQVCAAEKYDLVVQQDNAPFHSPAVDITRKVLDVMAVQKQP